MKDINKLLEILNKSVYRNLIGYFGKGAYYCIVQPDNEIVREASDKYSNENFKLRYYSHKDHAHKGSGKKYIKFWYFNHPYYFDKNTNQEKLIDSGSKKNYKDKLGPADIPTIENFLKNNGLQDYFNFTFGQKQNGGIAGKPNPYRYFHIHFETEEEAAEACDFFDFLYDNSSLTHEDFINKIKTNFTYNKWLNLANAVNATTEELKKEIENITISEDGTGTKGLQNIFDLIKNKEKLSSQKESYLNIKQETLLFYQIIKNLIEKWEPESLFINTEFETTTAGNSNQIEAKKYKESVVNFNKKIDILKDFEKDVKIFLFKINEKIEKLQILSKQEAEQEAEQEAKEREEIIKKTTEIEIAKADKQKKITIAIIIMGGVITLFLLLKK